MIELLYIILLRCKDYWTLVAISEIISGVISEVTDSSITPIMLHTINEVKLLYKIFLRLYSASFSNILSIIRRSIFDREEAWLGD